MPQIVAEIGLERDFKNEQDKAQAIKLMQELVSKASDDV
jgi:hypothetical protein